MFHPGTVPCIVLCALRAFSMAGSAEELPPTIRLGNADGVASASSESEKRRKASLLPHVVFLADKHKSFFGPGLITRAEQRCGDTNVRIEIARIVWLTQAVALTTDACRCWGQVFELNAPHKGTTRNRNCLQGGSLKVRFRDWVRKSWKVFRLPGAEHGNFDFDRMLAPEVLRIAPKAAMDIGVHVHKANEHTKTAAEELRAADVEALADTGGDGGVGGAAAASSSSAAPLPIVPVGPSHQVPNSGREDAVWRLASLSEQHGQHLHYAVEGILSMLTFSQNLRSSAEPGQALADAAEFLWTGGCTTLAAGATKQGFDGKMREPS